MAISNLLSGRVRLKGPKNVTADRYEFVDLSQVEPNLGVPDFPASFDSGSVGILASDSDGNRRFIKDIRISTAQGAFTGSFSGSAQLSGSFTGSYTGSFAGIFVGDGSQLTNVPSVVSPRIASGSATASVSPDKGLAVNTFATIGGNLTVTGSARITDDLIVENTIFAEKLIISYVSSSIIYSSGSNKFGDELSDKQEFTGSLFNLTP